MASIDALELVGQEESLIKSTPVEETMKRIARIRTMNINTANSDKIIWIKTCALIYVIKYLRKKLLCDGQIKELSLADLNCLPELILADREIRVVYLGWIPIFGWLFTYKYFLFKSRVKFLRSLYPNIFDGVDIDRAIYLSYPSRAM